MKRHHSLRRRLGGVAFFLLLAVLAAHDLPSMLLAQSQENAGSPSIQSTILQMESAERKALRIAPTVSATDAEINAIRSRLTSLLPSGASLAGIDVVENAAAAAGLIRRRFVVRIDSEPGLIAPSLVAVRRALPDLIASRITIDVAAATEAAPNPQVLIEATAWVEPQRSEQK